jgi:hypothetical protein
MPEVTSAWERLERAGVPYGDGGPERPDFGDLPAIADAVRVVLREGAELAPRMRTSLLAWLRAWASSFPTSFDAAFGDDAASVLAQAAEGVDDADRYLKLRRIAREKLCRAL